MQREFRLNSSTDFKRVRRIGKSYPHPLVVLVVLPNQSTRLRIGVAAGRSVGNAVQRNRAKRRLRAAIQPMLAEMKPGWDAILIARQPLLSAPFLELRQALRHLTVRAGILERNHDQQE